MKSEFRTSLSGTWIDDENYRLDKDLIYYSELLKREIFVPAGFVTDFSSVPRVPLVYWFWGGRCHHESVIHDFLYRTLPHICTRKEADMVFAEAMGARDKKDYIKNPMYLGVRLGGWASWRKDVK